MYEHGDDTLIEALIKSGEPMQSIADKWEVTLRNLQTYCKRKAINFPKEAKKDD